MPDLFNSPLAIIDVETTGLSYKNGGIIDVGILRVEQGQVVQTMRQLINPGAPLPAFITQLTGITNQDVSDAPSFSDIARDVYDLVEGCIFIAHNARFDYAFIKEEFSRVGYYYQPKQLCTVRLSKGLYPQYRSHKLDALIERLNLQVEDRHRAFDDAQATWQALQKMADQHSAEIFNSQVITQLKQPSLPTNIPPQLTKSLPKSPGVYIFKSANGATLYVGKSINIYDRVLSHFSDDHRSVKEMRISQEITDIQTITTNGELGALIKEAQLIKDLLPLHNRMLRRQTDMVLAVKSENPDGYPMVKIERHKEIDIGNRDTGCRLQDAVNFTENRKQKTENLSVSLDQVMGVFRSERQAKESLIKLAKEYRLCHKLLGLQKTTGACFMHQLKVCPGGCVGKESTLEYLFRFNQAFADTRIKQWPFNDTIIITENGSDGQSTGYVVNSWSIIGVVEQKDQEIEFTSHEPCFDLDQYKIIKRYIENPKNRLNIRLYTEEMAQSFDF